MAARGVLAALCCLLLVRASVASLSGDVSEFDRGAGVPAAAAGSTSGVLLRRMLRGTAEYNHESAEEHKEDLVEAEGEAGEYIDWIMACREGRERCPNLYLASWGYQCMTRDGDSCCLQPNGKFCTRLGRWEGQPTPKGWQGDNVLDGTPIDDPSEEQAKPSNEEDDDDTKKEEEEKKSDESKNKRSKDKDGSNDRSQEDDSGRRWRKAAATYYNSYPACCYDRNADQTECWQYNGCQWAGYFAAFNDRKSQSWVRDHNIISFFSSSDSGSWHSKWRGKWLRIKNPRNGNTMEVQIVDTCANSDCGGCCTRNANRHGGYLVDLEYHTAKRFWEGSIDGSAEIEWQEL